jgi:hypothetical protein
MILLGRAPGGTEVDTGSKLTPGIGDLHSWACVGGIIQSSGPLRFAIVDGMNVRDSRVHNYPPYGTPHQAKSC